MTDGLVCTEPPFFPSRASGARGIDKKAEIVARPLLVGQVRIAGGDIPRQIDPDIHQLPLQGHFERCLKVSHHQPGTAGCAVSARACLNA